MLAFTHKICFEQFFYLQGRGNYNNQGPESLSKTNLYIRGLTPNTSDQDLHNLCAQYGNIVSTKAIIDPVGGKCKGRFLGRLQCLKSHVTLVMEYGFKKSAQTWWNCSSTPNCKNKRFSPLLDFVFAIFDEF